VLTSIWRTSEETTATAGRQQGHHANEDKAEAAAEEEEPLGSRSMPRQHPSASVGTRQQGIAERAAEEEEPTLPDAHWHRSIRQHTSASDSIRQEEEAAALGNSELYCR
jgi:hypothetical protein